MVKTCVLVFLMKRHHQLLILAKRVHGPSHLCDPAQLRGSLWQVSAEGAIWTMSTIKEKKLISQCCTGNPPPDIELIHCSTPRCTLLSFYSLLPSVGLARNWGRTSPNSTDVCIKQYPGGHQHECSECYSHRGIILWASLPTCSFTGCFTEGKSWLASEWRMKDLRKHFIEPSVYLITVVL